MTKIMTNSIYGNKFSATIIGIEDAQFSCINNETTYSAQKALTCLVTPQIGDEVLKGLSIGINIFYYRYFKTPSSINIGN